MRPNKLWNSIFDDILDLLLLLRLLFLLTRQQHLWRSSIPGIQRLAAAAGALRRRIPITVEIPRLRAYTCIHTYIPQGDEIEPCRTGI
jgi:hypothetical protein